MNENTLEILDAIREALLEGLRLHPNWTTERRDYSNVRGLWLNCLDRTPVADIRLYPQYLCLVLYPRGDTGGGSQRFEYYDPQLPERIQQALDSWTGITTITLSPQRIT